MHAPIRPIRGRWPAPLERKFSRYFWRDPTVVMDECCTPDDFREAMSAFHVGDTIKITGADRHPKADALITDHLDLTGAAIVDIGASDGSTSVDLIARLPDFASYTIADLFFHLRANRVGSHVLFFDPDGTLILIVGRRALVWPTLSRAVRGLYLPLVRRARRDRAAPTEVLLLNPSARALINSDPRISYRVHDVFQRWGPPSPDVIKVANLLRRLYFSDADICSALTALLDSLNEGGHLLVVDNPRIQDIDERAGLYRRENGTFVRVAQTEHPAEIDDLVVATRIDPKAVGAP